MVDKTPQPMGGDLPEERHPQPQQQDIRNCWAIDVLVEEVKSLFDTGVMTHAPNWLAANMVVVFTPKEKDWEDLAILLSVIEDDDRIEALTIDEATKKITVQIVSNAILYDTRDTFGLDNAVLGLDRDDSTGSNDDAEGEL